MPADRVQVAVTGGDADTAAPTRHRRAQAPLVGVRVEALDGPEAGAAVPTPDGVEPGKRWRGG